ncbi:MAG TPA: hypothetical protein PKL73_19660 [Polyangiaceae bacterium]|nr:hypothetical protein [Polyangiaceae bacterium]HOD25401.1 hypothetical protein [Polyangiaceae bacterium]HOR38211.1 hypothetical protein [Polyangiaceae bacterium]HPY17843.1 hypothetical protein [Polyangiaceae bacterium]HQB42282.1 hypothetical protein [Polyangiaceae bacterium]
MRSGDLQAAETWLAPCDPRSDDLETDTAYRMSRALIDTAKQNWNAVLRVLGTNDSDIPIMDSFDTLAAVLRANALQRTGQEQEATALLRKALSTLGAVARPVLNRLLQTYAPLGLCAQSYPSAVQQRSQAAAENANAIDVKKFLFFLVSALGCGGTGVFVFVMSIVGIIEPGGMVAGVVFVIVGLIHLAIMYHDLNRRMKDKYIWLHGIQATERVVEIKNRRGPINNVVTMMFEAMVQVEGQSDYKASLSMTLNEKKPP